MVSNGARNMKKCVLQHSIDSYISLIINKYQNDLKHVKGSNCRDIFTNFYANVDSDFIIKWIDQLFNISSTKCLETSIHFREEGNIFFKKKDYKKGLQCYNNSLNSAIFNSVEFCLTLGNRSAVSYYLNKYTESIKDIELCFKLEYPKELQHKLFIRLINCYIQLKLTSKALEIIKQFERYVINCEASLTLDVKGLESMKNKIEVLKEQINNIKNETFKKCDTNLPQLKNGENTKFPYASNAISMQFSTEKGRHVIATEDISFGDVLFVEKPFCSVPIDVNIDDEEYYCYNCFVPTCTPISCDNCDFTYCSILCKNESWAKYHNLECLASCKHFWTQIGVGFLAFRMLVTGLSTSGVPTVVEGDFFEPVKDSYTYISSLQTNIGKMDVKHILPNLVHAMILTLYLKTKTDYFQYIKEKNDCFVDKNDDELSLIIGTNLLKHMLQIISNASTIEGVKNNFYDNFTILKQLKDTGKLVNGVAIYPSVSMMNHSCETNISSFFINDYVIIKANKNITKGEEIFNCYGYNFSKHATTERKINLLKQYYFNCICTACSCPSKPEMFNLGLQCLKCQKLSMPSCEYNCNYICSDCKFEFNANKQLKDLAIAKEYYDQFSASNKIDYLFKCEILREKILYKDHYLLYDVYLSLQLLYGHAGDFSKYWEYLQKQLHLDETLFGNGCLNYALNLRQGVLIFLDTLRANSSDETCFFKMQQFTSSAEKMLQKCKDIFRLHYPEDKLCFKSLDDAIKNAYAVEYNF